MTTPGDGKEWAASAARGIGRAVLWFLEGVAAWVGWFVASMFIGIAITSFATGAETETGALAAVLRLVLVATPIGAVVWSIWRRGLSAWVRSLGLPIGLAASLFFGAVAATDEDPLAAKITLVVAALGLVLFSVCAWYQPDRVTGWLRAVDLWLSGKRINDDEPEVSRLALIPFVPLTLFAVAALGAVDPPALSRFLPTGLRSWIATRHTSLVAAAVVLGIASFVALRGVGTGSVRRGVVVWLLALGQAGGFSVAFLAILLASFMLYDPIEPKGGIAMHVIGVAWSTRDVHIATVYLIGLVAAAIGFPCWLWRSRPGARQVKAAWVRVWGPVRPGFWRVANAIGRNRGKLWTLSLILAGTLEIVRETVPGQDRVWSAAYTAEAVSLLIAALLTISAMPGIIGMFFKPVTWQIIGWAFRMVWANVYQFGRISVSAFVSYLMQFGWVNGRFDPLGDFLVTITAAGNAMIAVLRTGDLWQLTLALPAPAGNTSDSIVFLLEWLYLSLWRVAELVCLIVMARYAVAVLIGLCRGVFHLIREHLQRQPPIRTQAPHGPPPDDWETIS